MSLFSVSRNRVHCFPFLWAVQGGDRWVLVAEGEKRRCRRGRLSLRGPGRLGAATGLGPIPGAMPMPSLCNLSIENLSRVGQGGH